MNYEEAFMWWAIGFGCGLVVMTALFLWEKWAKDEFSHAPRAVDEGYEEWLNTLQTPHAPEHDDDYFPPVPSKPLVAPVKLVKKSRKPSTKKSR